MGRTAAYAHCLNAVQCPRKPLAHSRGIALQKRLRGRPIPALFMVAIDYGDRDARLPGHPNDRLLSAISVQQIGQMTTSRAAQQRERPRWLDHTDQSSGHVIALSAGHMSDAPGVGAIDRPKLVHKESGVHQRIQRDAQNHVTPCPEHTYPLDTLRPRGTQPPPPISLPHPSRTASTNATMLSTGMSPGMW